MTDHVLLTEHINFVDKGKLTTHLYPHGINVEFNNIPQFWFENRPLFTFYENSISVFLTCIELFIVETVKEAMPFIQFDENLSKDDVLSFCQQEENHALMHKKFNECLRGHGFDVDGATAKFNKFINKYKQCSLSERLQLTVIAETTASLLAKIILEEYSYKNLPTEVKKLFIWHAVEEIEHRNIAFQVSNYFHQHKTKYSKKIILGFLGSLNSRIMGVTFSNLWRLGHFFRFSNVSDLYIMSFTKHGTSYRIVRAVFKFFSSNYDPYTEFNKKNINETIENWEKAYHAINNSHNTAAE